ncbi:MAG: SPASM domain-containing protein [Peptostreptococcaceae bacterium]|nr:SPASM domain-containing protein [Peptostreptococcaceae bacterium]
MVINYHDKYFNFYEFFNTENGTLVRTDSKSVEGVVSQPSMRSFPELLDVGIMGHCTNYNYSICQAAGIDCYQQGPKSKKPNMIFADYISILEQSKGKVFQIALGGAGDPNAHSEFVDILKATNDYGIVPNLTTSGSMLRKEDIMAMATYCGAVAVSYYSRLNESLKESNIHTINAVSKLKQGGCKVNVHYVINKDTIKDACIRLEKNIFPNEIDAVIFLLYKPVGFGLKEKTIQIDEPSLDHFLYLVFNNPHPFQIGFDTCFTPALLPYSKKLLSESIDTCEAAKFSMYIDCELNAFPCSFGLDIFNGISLREKSINGIWWSKEFSDFRKLTAYNECNDCKDFWFCNGGCPLKLPITICAQSKSQK